jgi:Delta3-Delta2-enoyl-CoA isomerase
MFILMVCCEPGTLAELNKDSLKLTKQLIRESLPSSDAANVKEIFAGADRFGSGDPLIQFAKMANKEKKHKL